MEVVRGFVVILGTAAGYWIGRDAGAGPEAAALAGMLGCLFGYVGGGIFGRLLERGLGVVEARVDRAPTSQVLAGLVGGSLGALAGAVLVTPLFAFVPWRFVAIASGLSAWICGVAGSRITAHKSEQLFSALGLSTRPLMRATAYGHADGFIVDTSAVMDGQLLALARSGVLGGDLFITRFVLDELQGFADAADGVRSRRAQSGLEILDALRRDGPVRVYVLDDEVPEHRDVDTKLVELAVRLQLRLLTNDGNLARVASVRGVPVTNLRRLAQDLAPPVTAGDALEIALVKPGKDPDQGVGYLDDGSMVVVNGGADLVGRGPVAIEVASVVPTSAGRIVFAHPE